MNNKYILKNHMNVLIDQMVIIEMDTISNLRAFDLVNF